ncbi:hypothetical protein [Halomarina ordinaria]|uniref:Uncharacterized protein n=1 Tax=Halomarina ordinaria TaxID=3033939 RepID=A0ABD5U5G1_9EURY|nr:hypothetical protein [Halomarina sp. PSRA2]
MTDTPSVDPPLRDEHLFGSIEESPPRPHDDLVACGMRALGTSKPAVERLLETELTPGELESIVREYNRR